MDFIELDENTLRNNSFKRNINQLFEIFFEDTPHSNYKVINIGEYFEASKDIYLRFTHTPSIRNHIELVPTIYKNSLNPTEEEYLLFRENYFKQIIISYLLSQNTPLKAYNIDLNSKKILKPSFTTNYEDMKSNKWIFNTVMLHKDETIKFLFEYYYNEIEKIVKDLSKNQPTYFKKISEVTNRNVQPNNVPLFMDLIVERYKRLLELLKLYSAEDKKQELLDLISERNELVKKINDIDEKIEDGNSKGKALTFSSGKASAKLFMYEENKNGFIENVLFAFLVGLTSGLSFFFVSALVKFIINRI